MVRKVKIIKRCYPVAGENYQEWGYAILEYTPEMSFSESKGFWIFKKEVKSYIPEKWKSVSSYGKEVIFRTKKEAEEFLRLSKLKEQD